MKDSNNYNGIAGIYDALGNLVYGSALKKSQLALLHLLPKQQRILFIGGGTGTLLDPILEICDPLELVYVEKSLIMLNLSQKHCRHIAREKVTFIHGTEDSVKGETFDAVITFFFFDQFSWFSLNRIFRKLNVALKPRGYWLWADFVPPEKKWQHLLMRMMLVFFKITTGLSTNRVFSIQNVFSRSGLRETDRCYFYGSFIQSALFRKLS